MKKNARKHSGFTLIELAIVLVIIGLIVGSIVAGSSLIRNSELQAILTESAKYTQAISNFRDKYKALPGDFNTATDIWGASDATPATCIINPSPTNAIVTCNGDGNGRIMDQSSVSATYYEQWRAWQHLANAQMIEGNYSGLSAPLPPDFYNYVIGQNIPASKLSGAGWKIVTITTRDVLNGVTSDIPYINNADIQPNLLLWLGGALAKDDNRMRNVLNADEAYSIDLKIDDGKPSTGKLIQQDNTNITGTCDSGGNEYNIAETIQNCGAIFKTGL